MTTLLETAGLCLPAVLSAVGASGRGWNVWVVLGVIGVVLIVVLPNRRSRRRLSDGRTTWPCPRCGTPRRPGGRYCARCGIRLPGP